MALAPLYNASTKILTVLTIGGFKTVYPGEPIPVTTPSPLNAALAAYGNAQIANINAMTAAGWLLPGEGEGSPGGPV